VPPWRSAGRPLLGKAYAVGASSLHPNPIHGVKDAPACTGIAREHLHLLAGQSVAGA